MLCGSTGVSDAQDVERLRDLARKIQTHDQVLTGLRDATGEAAQNSPEPQVVLVSSATDTVAKARIGFLITNQQLLDAVVSGPIRNGSAELFDRQGLGGSVTLQVRLAQIVWSRQVTRTTDTNSVRSLVPPDEEPTFDDLVRAAVVRAAPSTRSLSPEDVRQTASGDVSSLARTVAATSEGRRSFARSWREIALQSGAIQTRQSVLVAGSYTVGNKDFEFVPSVGSVVEQASRTNRAWEFSGGLLQAKGAKDEPSVPVLYVGGSYQASRRYAAGSDPASLCRPDITEAAVLRCNDLVVGGPTRKDARSLQGDFRWWVSASKLAVAFRPSHDFESGDSKFEFPIYFLANVADTSSLEQASTPGLTGGLSLGISDRSGRRGYFATFFVGTVLRLPGIPK
jgi:hypothetical protein